jgi:hypothetical protein
MAVTNLLAQSCNKADNAIKLITSLFQTCYNKLGTSSANTTCWQHVNRLVTTCLQTCYKLCVFTSLPTSRQQVVFALLVPSCQKVWDKLLTTCNNLVDIIRLVARLFQQVRHSHDITILLQHCVVNLVTFLLYHDCIRLVRTNLLTACSKLVTTTGNKQCEHNLSTACERICNNLFADL